MFGFGARSPVKSLTPTQVRQMGDTVTLVDVRENAEWAAGHIAGAIHIPLGRLRQEIELIPSDKPVVFYCQAGGRSSQAIAIARAAGSRMTRIWTAASVLGVRKDSLQQADGTNVFTWH